MSSVCPTERKKKKKRILPIVLLLLLVVILGVGLMIYPMFAARYAEQTRSEIHTHYQEVIQHVDTSYMDEIWAKAEAYNASYFRGELNPLTPEENGYFEQLVVPDTSIMAYVDIPKIDVRLPVFHGIGEDALKQGAGHMPQSSLPIGGENTHSVISAHTGMAQSPMFSDLELMEVGDTFTIEVLGKVLTYQVYDIQVVLPVDISNTKIETGKDICTLVTCTPFGVNTHRLLVHGERIETLPEEEAPVQETVPVTKEQVESVWDAQYWRSVYIGIGIAVLAFLLLLIILIIRTIIRKKRRKQASHGE